MAEFRQVLHIHIDRRIDDYVQAKQNDTASRFLDCKLFNQYGVPYDLTKHKIRIALIKPDGNKIFNDGKLTRPTEGMFAFELTTQTLSTVGIVKAEIKILTEDEKSTLTTKTFDIEVLEELWDENSIESSNEYGAVVQLFQDVWEVRQSIFGMEKSVGTPQDELTGEETPTSLTLFGGINKIRNYLFNKILPNINNNIKDVKDEVNENVDNRFNDLSKQINFVTPTFATIHKKETTPVPRFPGGTREMDIRIHTGSGVLNWLRIQMYTTQFNYREVTVITESGQFPYRYPYTATFFPDRGHDYSIHFEKYLSLRVRCSPSGQTAANPEIFYEAFITIPT